MIRNINHTFQWVALFCALFCYADSGHSQIVPNTRHGNWIEGVTVGVPGGIPTNRNTICANVKDPAYGGYGGNVEVTGSTTQGSSTITLSSAGNFQPSQSITILCGRPDIVTLTFTKSSGADGNFALTLPSTNILYYNPQAGMPPFQLANLVLQRPVPYWQIEPVPGSPESVRFISTYNGARGSASFLSGTSNTTATIAVEQVGFQDQKDTKIVAMNGSTITTRDPTPRTAANCTISHRYNEAGSVVAGNNQLTLLEPLDFKIGHGVKVDYGIPEIVAFRITKGATANGSICMSLPMTGAVEIPVQAGDTPEQIIARLRAKDTYLWTKNSASSSTADTIVFTCTENGNRGDGQFDGACSTQGSNAFLGKGTPTGVTATFSVQREGALDLFTSVTGVNGNVLTLKDTPTRSASPIGIYHDDSVAIQKAIDSCPPNQVVLIPSGIYQSYRTISLDDTRDGITLRGEGDSTLIDVRNEIGPGISIGTERDYLWSNPSAPITGNPHKAIPGSTESTISIVNTAPFTVGRLARINLVKNDSALPVISVSNFPKLRSQITRIVRKTSNSLTISPPLLFDLPEALDPRISVASAQSEFIGVEKLKIIGKNSGAGLSLKMQQCYGCWLKDVSAYLTSSFHFHIDDSLQSEVRHCDVRLRSSPGGSPNGAGILTHMVSSSLFEDNIVADIFPLFEVNDSSAGNVFAHNFTIDRVGPGQLDSNHNPHNSYNLWEGNIAPRLQSDGYFGSESEGTIFRNWLTADRSSYAIDLCRFSRNFSIIGNILGRSDGKPFLGVLTPYLKPGEANLPGSPRYPYRFGYPNMGGNGGSSVQAPPWKDTGTTIGANGFQEIDSGVLPSTIIRSNWNAYSAGIPTSEALSANETLPASLFRATKPVWFGNLAWPPFDPNKPNQNYEAIPAGYRFIHGYDPPGLPSDNKVPATPTHLRVQ